MTRKIPKIGFDFDGVIAYNPLRIFRYSVLVFQRFITGRKDLHFVYPKRRVSKFLLSLAHKAGFFPSAGFDELKELVRKKKIQAYLITGRYSFLEKSLYDWLKRHKAEHIFSGIYVNTNDEEPHLFKEKMLNKLHLDAFVEDNWDIVHYLQSKFHHTQKLNTQTTIHWIYNILDRFKHYPYKYPHLKKFIENIR